MNDHSPPANATARFSDRVADYVRHRPGYPTGVLDWLVSRAALGPGAIVADLGSGTGIFTQLLLAHGAEVFAVEPNADMRAVAEARLGGERRFHSTAAPAEATTLPSGTVDLVTAAQAFHWFRRDAVRAECDRLLRPHGRIALVWNVRRTHATPFLREYERLLLRHAPDYARVRHENVDDATLSSFFRDGPHEQASFPHEQRFDFPSLRGRLLSCSYAPPAGHPQHEPMLAELRRLFDANATNGEVAFVYDAVVHLGR